MFDFDVIKKEDGYLVQLPHQCEEWTVAGGEKYWTGTTKEKAIEQLETFIKEAQEALEKLKQS